MNDGIRTEAVGQWWNEHARALILTGAFVAPLFCSSPWFVPPLADQIPQQSPVGILYQALRRIPLMITELGFLAWLAWRIGWRPSRRRSVSMFALSFFGLIVLPVVCRAVDGFTVQLATNDPRTSLQIAWRIWRQQAPMLVIAQVVRAGVMLLSLRVALWWRSAALCEPDSPPTVTAAGPQFSIASLLVITALTAVSVAWLPVLLPRFFWVDQFDLLVRLPVGLLISAVHWAAIALVFFAVARIGIRSFGEVVPWLVILVVAVAALMYAGNLIQVWLVPGAGGNAQLTSYLPYAITLVTASEFVLLLFHSIGLQVRFRDRSQDTAFASLGHH